jgi:hypothetical protein
VPQALEHRDCGAGRHCFHYPDDTRFYLDLAQATVWGTWPAPLTLEDTATYLLGPILGFYLRLRGYVCLHGSAVMLGKHCAAFVGPAGSGKSTLAAAFAARGCSVLTEDVACLDAQDAGFVVRPGYPRIRLWDDASGQLSADLPLLTPNWEKRYLALGSDAHPFRVTPAPLTAIFLLQPRRALEAPAELGALSGQERMSRLVANTYGNRLLDREMRAHEFEVLGRVVQAVPVRALTLCDEGRRLPEACAWIERHALG